MSSTLDILWIVLAFSVLWVSAFLCWALYHIAMIARKVHFVVDEVKTTLQQIEGAIHGVKEKLEHHANLLDPLIAVAGTMMRRHKDAKQLKGKKP